MDQSIRQLITQLLSDEDPDRRRVAAEDLSGDSGMYVVPSLAVALKDENKGVRDAAAHALLAIGGEGVARAVVENICDENLITRNLAGELLLQLGTSSVRPLLLYLQDTSHDVRKFAVDLLGAIGAEAAVPQILPLLDDSDPNVIVSAAEALGNIRQSSTVSYLFQCFEDHPIARHAVIEALGKIGDPKAAGFLLLCFREAVARNGGEPLLIYLLIEALGAIGGADAYEEFLRRLHTIESTFVPALVVAIVTLARSIGSPLAQDERVLPILFQLAKDGDEQEQLASVMWLSEIPGDEVTKALVGALGSSAQTDASIQLQLPKRPASVRMLLEELACASSQRCGALAACVARNGARVARDLVKSDGQEVPAELLQRAFDAIVKEWWNIDEGDRTVILEALFRLDIDRTISFLDGLASDPDPWIRVTLVELIGQSTDARVPELVARFLNDEDETVRNVAETVLRSLGSPNEFAPSIP